MVARPLGRYRILEKLGGSMGVPKAGDTRLNRDSRDRAAGLAKFRRGERRETP